MAQSVATSPETDAEHLDAAADAAIAACDGDARGAVKALIVANEFLEAQVDDLMQSVSHAYARGRFRPING